ncbi:MAG: hypothetical protein IPL95_13700 [Saprospiraceae bacterium]|nr:hypothetical protein [Saprospiraceae bacterium]
MKIHSINLNLQVDNELLHIGNSIYASTKGKMHPSGNYIYGTNNGISPSDIEKYSILNGNAEYLYDSPYHGDYPISGDLWFSEDGLRVFTRGKTVLRTSANKDQDMLYNGTIALESNFAHIMNLDYSTVKNNIYIISSDEDTWTNKRKPFIYIYNSNNLLFKSKIELEKYLVGANFYDAEPYFVFSNSSGNSIYVFTKAKGSGLVNEWGLQKIDI